MTRLTLPALGLAVLLAAPVTAHAQLRSHAVDSRTAAVADARIAGPELDRATALARAGQFRKAARVFHSAAEEQLEHGVLPADALWQEASMYFAVKENAHAARVLDALASHASAYGDPVVEARAMLHSAVLYAQSGDRFRASELAAGLRLLRNSPFLDGELRAEIDARLGADGL